MQATEQIREKVKREKIPNEPTYCYANYQNRSKQISMKLPNKTSIQTSLQALEESVEQKNVVSIDACNKLDKQVRKQTLDDEKLHEQQFKLDN